MVSVTKASLRDAQAWPQPSFEANEPPILRMAPKKEKPTGSANYKIWEPSLIAAHLNQVSPSSQVPLVPGAWSTLCSALFSQRQVLGKGVS